MWSAIAAYVVISTRHARQERAAIKVERLHIVITDTTRVVTAEKVTSWLRESSIDPIGRSVDSADTRTIERRIASRPEVRHVSAWTDLSGNLTVRVVPRTPALRVLTANGYRFWFTDDGVILTDRGEFTALVPVVTGVIDFPFAPDAEGSYAQMQADLRLDYLDRFTALAAERQTLSARRSSIRADIRATASSSPKRWWSQSRRQIFADGRAARIAQLERSAAETSAELAKIDRLERSLREKEKKSYQSHRYLSKLANFVEFIRADDFWSAQIVQIDATAEGGVSTQSGRRRASTPDEWREPQLELIPRAGDHIIVLGGLDGTERARLANLRLFYEQGLWHEGWSAYDRINIKYRNQIVCTK